MKSCDECKYYHAEYGGVCFAQKDAPRVFWQVAETCDDFTYKDARILLGSDRRWNYKHDSYRGI